MNKKIYLTAICTAFLSLTANAQTTKEGQSTFPQPREVMTSSEWKPHVGLLAGNSVPEGSAIVSPEFGIDIGFQPYIPFGVGAEFVHTQVDSGTEIRSRNTVWAKGTYNFGGTIPVIKDSYLGVALGAVFTPDETAIAGAPIVGFDIPIRIEDQAHFSVGASSKYAVISNDELDALSVNAVVKYWY